MSTCGGDSFHCFHVKGFVAAQPYSSLSPCRKGMPAPLCASPGAGCWVGRLAPTPGALQVLSAAPAHGATTRALGAGWGGDSRNGGSWWHGPDTAPVVSQGTRQPTKTACTGSRAAPRWTSSKTAGSRSALWRWSGSCSPTRTSQVRAGAPWMVLGPCPVLVPRCWHGATRGLVPRGCCPAFPSSGPRLGEERAAFEARHQSSLGAEATELTAGCQVSSSSHLTLEMRL